MKKNSTKTVMILLLTMLVSNVFAQPKPWKCDGRVIGTWGSANAYNSNTNLYVASFDASGNVVYLPKTATTGIGINGIGFRKQDSYVYGIRYEQSSGSATNELVRIDSAGTFTSLGTITGIPKSTYYAGAIDVTGFMYVISSSNNTLYKINLDTRVATSIGSVGSPSFADIAFDPLTNVLYGTTSSNARLYSINTTTGASTAIGGSNDGNTFGLFFTDGAELYGFNDPSSGSNRYYKINKATGALTSAGTGPTATYADACSCPFRLSHTLKAKASCLLPGKDSVFQVAITNITTTAQPATFDLTMDKRFRFTETAIQIQTNIQTAFPGSSAVVTISSANGGTNNVISINSINVPVTTTTPTSFKLAWKANAAGFAAGEQILFQSTVDVPGNTLSLGADVSDDPLTAQLDDATTITICTPDGGPLPVTLADFKASLNQKIANINWTTAQELNTQKFDIERSFDGENFIAVKSVEAHGANQAYQYNDMNVANAVVYYRIKMIDYNGNYKYSSIVVLKTNDLSKETTIYPSPFNNQIAINTYSVAKGKITVVLTDAIGRKVSAKTSLAEAGNNTVILNDLSKLQKGLYLVHIYNNDKLTETKRAIKAQ